VTIQFELFSQRWWLIPVILATQEAEIRIVFQSQLGPIVLKTLSQTPSQKRAGGMAQGEGHEFKPQDCKINTKINMFRNRRKQGDVLTRTEGRELC
jgi:hypothetical protein